MKGELKSREECLREAAEYDRLARLARLKSSRKVLTLSASYWRKRAQDAAKRAGEVQSARIHWILNPRASAQPHVGTAGHYERDNFVDSCHRQVRLTLPTEGDGNFPVPAQWGKLGGVIEGEHHDREVSMTLRKFIIERDIPAVGSLEREQLRGAAAQSNGVLRQLGPDIQWVESYVAADKTFCVYLAKDEDVIKEHAKLSGFPATKITEVRKMIDPTTEHAA
jgi:hypothetical protein